MSYKIFCQTVALLLFTLALGCGAKKNSNNETPPVDPPPIQEKVLSEETQKFFRDLENVYSARLENAERVTISKTDQRAIYRFHRDISLYDAKFQSLTICVYEFEGDVIDVQMREEEIFFTRHKVFHMDLEVNRMRVISAGPGTDFRKCAEFEEQQIQRLPFVEKKIPFLYEFITPEDVFRLEDRGDESVGKSGFDFINLEVSKEDKLSNYDVVFLANRFIDVPDEFVVSPLVDNHSYIYDLGRRSCLDLQPVTVRRYLEPLAWLKESEANPADLKPMQRAPVALGHCYLLVSNDFSSRVVAMFRVRDFVKGDEVVLHEVEVLDILQRDGR